MSVMDKIVVALLIWTVLSVLANPWLENRKLSLISVGLGLATTIAWVLS